MRTSQATSFPFIHETPYYPDIVLYPIAVDYAQERQLSMHLQSRCATLTTSVAPRFIMVLACYSIYVQFSHFIH
jgi:hypothetical protein